MISNFLAILKKIWRNFNWKTNLFVVPAFITNSKVIYILNTLVQISFKSIGFSIFADPVFRRWTRKLTRTQKHENVNIEIRQMGNKICLYVNIAFGWSLSAFSSISGNSLPILVDPSAFFNIREKEKNSFCFNLLGHWWFGVRRSGGNLLFFDLCHSRGSSGGSRPYAEQINVGA